MELVRLKDSGFSFEVAFSTNDRDQMYFQSFGFASKSIGFFKQALYRVGAVCVAVEMAVAGEPAVRMVHDFGRLPPGGQWRHVFVFTNTLDHPLEIEAADKSCSCLEIEDWPRIIAAG